jgi:hypothetical protein
LTTPAFVAAFLAAGAAALAAVLVGVFAVTASSAAAGVLLVAGLAADFVVVFLAAVFVGAVVRLVAVFVAAAVVLRVVATVPPLVPVRVFFVLECGASTTISMSWASSVVRTGFICFRSRSASAWARAISVPVMVPLLVPLTRSCMIASCWNTFGRVAGVPAVVAFGTDAVAFRRGSRQMIAPTPGMHHHNEREWGFVPGEPGLLESIPDSISRSRLMRSGTPTL